MMILVQPEPWACACNKIVESVIIYFSFLGYLWLLGRRLPRKSTLKDRTNISIFIPEIPLQKEISEKVLAFETKIGIGEHYLNALEKQKQYLLQQMFI